jgi:hypothetical protein
LGAQNIFSRGGVWLLWAGEGKDVLCYGPKAARYPPDVYRYRFEYEFCTGEYGVESDSWRYGWDDYGEWSANAVAQPYSVVAITGSEQDVLPNGLVLE